MLDLFPPTQAPTLRDYQEQCLNAITSYQASGGRRALVALPTGTGKTVIFAQLPTLFPQSKMLVLAHREELLDQAAAKIRDANPGLLVSIEQADRRMDPTAQVVVASIQTLSVSPGRLLALRPGLFSLVVVDEAHHALAPTYLRTLAHFGLAPDLSALYREDTESKGGRRAFGHAAQELLGTFRPAPGAPLLVGFTATPSRTDGGGLEWVFDKLVFSRTIREMMEAGWLCEMRGKTIATDTEITHVRVRAGDFAEGELAEVVNTPRRNALAVQSYLEHADGRQALVFAVDVAHTEALYEAFLDAGVAADMVVGETPARERAQAIEDYRNGEVQVLVNCMVLTEGFDAPETSCIVMARPTKSSLLYTQMLGRGTRIAPGKQDLLVLDMVDAGATAGVQSLNTLFGLAPDDSTDKGLLRALLRKDLDEEVAARRAKPRTAYVEETADEDPLQAIRLPPEVASQVTLAWARIPAGYVLGIPGAGQLGVVEHGFESPAYAASGKVMGAERVLEYARVAFRPEDGLVQPIGDFGSLGEALRAAEDWVQEQLPGSAGMLRGDAHWRMAQDPPTPKQVKLLQSMGLVVPDGLTKGQASNMIDAALATQGPPKATAAQLWRLRHEGIRHEKTITRQQASRLISEAVRRQEEP